MTKQVLSVGQCVPDHGSITRFLHSRFDVQISTAATAVDALDELRKRPYDLVLINRKLDEDYTDGTDIIRAMKQDSRLAGVPVMLVSNYPEYQQEAVALGALYGIGKDQLATGDAAAVLMPVLG